MPQSNRDSYNPERVIIPTEEILQDIADTEAEIEVMKGEVEAYKRIPRQSREYKISQMRVEHRLNGIKEREEFILKLRGILAARSGDKIDRILK